MRQSSRASTLVVTLALVLICVVMMVPIIWTGLSALKPIDVAFANPPKFTFVPTLDAFERLWKQTDFAKYLLNTLMVAFISVFATIVIAAPCAYALSRVSGRTAALILGFALFLRASPAFATIFPFYAYAVKFDLYDTVIGLSVAFAAIDQPFTIWLLRGFFVEIPRELDDAAMIDGCGRWRAFWHVILPVCAPGLITAAILTFLLAFQEYMYPVVLTDVEAKTAPVFLTSQLGQTLPLLQQAAAGVTLLTLPIICAAFVVQRYLIAGLTSGSVKG